MSTVEKQRTPEAVATAFPFKEYFADAPQALFAGKAYEAVRMWAGEAPAGPGGHARKGR